MRMRDAEPLVAVDVNQTARTLRHVAASLTKMLPLARLRIRQLSVSSAVGLSPAAASPFRAYASTVRDIRWSWVFSLAESGCSFAAASVSFRGTDPRLLAQEAARVCSLVAVHTSGLDGPLIRLCAHVLAGTPPTPFPPGHGIMHLGCRRAWTETSNGYSDTIGHCLLIDAPDPKAYRLVSS